MLLLALIILVLWAAGAFVPVSPIRGSPLVHLILLVAVVLLLFHFLGGGGPHWRRL